MLYKAENGRIALGGASMDYIAFGAGARTLVMLPGVGDGLRTVRGTALPFALMYRRFAGRFRVYMFSRKSPLEPGYSTRDMAADVKLAMDALGLATASVLGVSQGGMIAQYVALDYPAAVEKLVLAVTSARPNAMLEEVLSRWTEMARRGEYARLMRDSAESAYSDAYLRAHRLTLPLLGLTGKPKDFGRFIIQAESCLSHDALGRLEEIRCPTLVLGGGEDRVLGAEASRELAAGIAGSELHIYGALGHAAYEEAEDFQQRIIGFLCA